MSVWLGGARGIPAGWHQLAEELDRDLLAIAGRADYCVFNEVKQKHGSLRIYTMFASDLDDATRRRLTGRINEAERLSTKICQHCGEPGVRRVQESGRTYTLCERCAAPRSDRRQQ